MRKHTPGPWWVESQHYQSRKDKPMYDIFVLGQGMAVSITSQSHVTETDKANAQLIAAAPQMLTVLEIALAHVNTPEVKSLIREAIKKARGI